MSCRVYNLFSALMLLAQVSKGEVFLTMFQKLMFNKQNTILFIYKFDLSLGSMQYPCSLVHKTVQTCFKTMETRIQLVY